MAAEEFQESEVIFPDHDHNYSSYQNVSDHHSSRVSSTKAKKKKQQHKNKKSSSSSTQSSMPVNIPENVFQLAAMDEFEEEDYEDELVPPHVIVARRVAGKMEFSVCTGNGRTLKGRDLSQVRNSILRMTGFLES